MLPLPSRTHPKKQTPVVYTEELTHLRILRANDRQVNEHKEVDGAMKRQSLKNPDYTH